MTTYLSQSLRRALLAAAVVSLTFVTAQAAGASRPVDLRVLVPGGPLGAKQLADQVQYTGTARFRTDPDADCFGEGTEGSGKRVRVRGATPLGAVVHGSAVERRLRPVSVTDAFDFGLGVCAIGGFEAPSTGLWGIRHNHSVPTAGGDQLRLSAGDQVIWYLDPDFSDAIPVELEIDAPFRAKLDQPFRVRVFQYDESGDRSPAAGVEVTGAQAPTDANGFTSVTLSEGGRIAAARAADGALPDFADVCVAERRTQCPRQVGRLIGGSPKRDIVEGTAGDDRILTRGGRDLVQAVDGIVDVVNCGSGRDTAVADADDELRSCERVTR